MRRSASAPDSSFPWTFPASQRIAGECAARFAARAVGVRGLRSAAAFARIVASVLGVRLPGFPTIEYLSGRPSHDVANWPLTTRELAASSAPM